MSHPRRSERGEGKLGCLLTLLVVGAMVAIAIKAFPVYYSNMELADACEFMATEASRLPREQVEGNVKLKAKELGIEEALKPGAIQVQKVATDSGTCTITLRYTRSIDFYGLYTHKLETNKSITKVIFTNI